MKKVILCSLLAFFVGRIIAQNNIQSLPVGAEAPMINAEMLDISEKTVSIKSAMSNNGVLVMFSCNTCPYVIKNQERTKAIAAFAQKNNVGVLILNSNEAKRTDDDSFEAMKAYAKAQGYNFYYAEDAKSTLANAFGATRTPEVFLINAKGIIVYKGAIDDNPSEAENVKRQHLKLAIEELVAGKSITVKESKSVGCTIKRNG
ncbi:MAG: thioredoxin family protein [Chitinophagaceae bacterium]|jgi:thioredoxin-related protein|nr:thioredoxin family protein [Chitinophagaceae bacterium]